MLLPTSVSYPRKQAIGAGTVPGGGATVVTGILVVVLVNFLAANKREQDLVGVGVGVGSPVIPKASRVGGVAVFDLL
jgi:hypothetical protein